MRRGSVAVAAPGRGREGQGVAPADLPRGAARGCPAIHDHRFGVVSSTYLYMVITSVVPYQRW
eukprot:365293-Chlamydomonas_euryale.AAC.11